MLKVPAARAIAVVVVLLLTWVAYGNVATLAQSPQSDAYKIDCLQPKDAAESGVCEQSKANDLANQAIKLNDKQFWVAFYGLIGLIATVLFSFVGTIFAVISGKSARDQTKILRDSLIQERRAWIKTELESRGPLESDGFYIGASVAVRITNMGMSPAHNIHTNMMFFEYKDQGNIKNIVTKFARENEYQDIEGGRFLLPQDFYYRPWHPSIILSNKNKGGSWVGVILIVCVSYEIMNSRKIHQTVTTYVLDGWDVDHGNVTLKEPDFAQFTAWSGGFSC